MSYVVSQPSEGSLAETLEDLTASGRRDLVLVSAAYATRSGVDQLAAILGSSQELWENSQKLFLVGLDFGLTEPDAIRSLEAIPQADVRVFLPRETLAAQLRPRHRFHPKVYGLAAGTWSAPQEIVLVVGSNNLTGSGLVDNEECFAVNAADASLEASFLQLVRRITEQPQPTPDLLDEYAALRGAADVEPPAGASSHKPASPLPLSLQRALKMARFFWTDTLSINPNRGANFPGNQIDLKKGARAFFGFSALDAPPNSALGEVMIQLKGYPSQECHMRFGDNQMDKLTLPKIDAPPVSYANRCLLFERTASGFLLRLPSLKDRREIAASSTQSGSLFRYAGSPRQWGFFS